jgi:uncharacterized protein YcbK (DUF882 family)
LHTKPGTINHDRRRLVAATAFTLPALALSAGAVRAAATPKALRFYHTHTSEQLDLVYHEAGRYLDDALTALNEFLRDFRTGEVHPINPRLLDVLHEAQRLIGSPGTYQIISGYRSPKTNEMLRQRASSSGVAKKSFHMTGNAVDIRLTGTPTATLRDAARSLRAGGVGYYASSDFIHVDTGRVRFW